MVNHALSVVHIPSSHELDELPSQVTAKNKHGLAHYLAQD